MSNFLLLRHLNLFFDNRYSVINMDTVQRISVIKIDTGYEVCMIFNISHEGYPESLLLSFHESYEDAEEAVENAWRKIKKA